MRQMVISGIRPSFPGLSRNQGQVTHVLLTRSPLIHPDASTQASAFDLHVLSTQPAFVLSQDQTLHKKLFMLQHESQQDSQPDHGGDRSWPNTMSHQKKCFWHHKLVQTNTLLDSQTTNTHPSPQPTKRAMFTGGIRFIIATPHPNQPNRTRIRPGQTR